MFVARGCNNNLHLKSSMSQQASVTLLQDSQGSSILYSKSISHNNASNNDVNN